MNERWEYRLELLMTINGENALNQLGAEGWELVAFAADGRCVFKRPRRAESPASRHEKAVAEGVNRFVESVAGTKRIAEGEE